MARDKANLTLSSLGWIRLRSGASQRGTGKLKPGDLIREVLYPLTEMAVLLGMIVLFLLGALAKAAGILGLWLAVIIVPAYFRYLLYLLEARANGLDATVLGAELFSIIENFWSLFPLILVCLLIWGEYFLLNHFPLAVAIVPGVVVLLLFPASMAVLAMSRSPIESLNPAALFVLIKSCHPDYILIPIVIAAITVAISYLVKLDFPGVVIYALSMYASVLMFTLTGSVVHTNAAKIKVDIPPPMEADAEQLDADLTRERTQVLNHAYGFVSRGNRQGGLQHIQDWIGKEVDVAAAYRWFFEQMLKWESKDAALFFAQKYLSMLLAEQRDIDALKLISRCRLEDARFKPLPEDRHEAFAAAERQHHDELCEYLKP
jgi:hypothetical protein